MRVRFESGPSLGASLLFAAACAPTPSAQTTEPTVETLEVLRSAADCRPAAEGCSYARIVRLRIGGIDPAAAERINTTVETHLRASTFEGGVHATLEGVGEEVLAEHAAFRVEFPDMEIPWMLERVASVRFRDQGLLSVAIDETVFLGGAHPNSARTHHVFDLATGSRLELEELLEAGSLEALTRAGETAFRQARGLGAADPLEEAGFWFADNAFALNDNWAVVEEGIAFRFDPYEVTSYAGGPTDFTIPREALADLVRADGPLAFFGAAER